MLVLLGLALFFVSSLFGFLWTFERMKPKGFAPLAQLVEQLTLNQWVRGSSPRRCTIEVGFFNAKGTPVPIPNTVVKLCSADNTRREAAREDKSKPTQAKRS